MQKMMNNQIKDLRITGGSIAEWTVELISFISSANILKRREFDGLDPYMLSFFELSLAKQGLRVKK